jgi:hydroxymethylpyrimidine/phosphomethylpyrimidine kinase
VKGGHLVNDATDLLYENGTPRWFRSERVLNPKTHGTGCTLSSAIACNLAAGKSMDESIGRAKEYLTARAERHAGFGKGLRTAGSYV